jgi:putative hemolysin
MMEIWIPVLVVSVCLFCEGFFSGSEMALLACDKIRMRERADTGDQGARLLLKLLETPQRLFGVTLVGTNLSVVTATTVVTLFLVSEYGPAADSWTPLIMSPLVLLFGEIAPKIVFRAHADRVATRIIRPLWLFGHAVAPLVWAISGLTGRLMRSLRVEGSRRALVTREALQGLLRLPAEEGLIPADERRMIRRIFQFATRPVREVMIPLSDVCAVEVTDPIERAVALFQERGFSRLPVFRERIDNVQGVLHSFDLLQARPELPTVGLLARPALFIPETQIVDDLLEQMRREGHGMAIVVDEYGGAVGVVTVEDLVEEIVGEIEDEHDPREAEYRRLGPRSYAVSARMGIEDLNEVFALEIPTGDYQTLAGFLLDRLRRFPSVGEQVAVEGGRFTVTRVTERAIVEVHLRLDRLPARGRRPPSPPPSSEEDSSPV